MGKAYASSRARTDHAHAPTYAGSPPPTQALEATRLEGAEGWLIRRPAGLGEEFGNAPGSITVATGLFVAARPHLALGVRLGRHSLGTSTTIIRDLYGPGSVQREDYSQTLWEVSLNACRREPLGRLRMDLCVGAGPYLLRSRDRIVTRDSTGAQISDYDFLEKRSDLHVGYHLAIALDRPRALGSWGIGVEGTYHQAHILGDMFVTMALRVILN